MLFFSQEIFKGAQESPGGAVETERNRAVASFLQVAAQGGGREEMNVAGSF